MTTASVVSGANPWLAHTVRIADITPEAPGVTTYDLEFTDAAQNARYQFLPGQFNMLYLPGVGESAVSLSAHPQSRGRWAHTIRVAGNVTQSLARLGKGATLGLRGPFGSSWPLADCLGRDLVFVAGGIGLAPLRPALYHVLEQRSRYGEVTLLYGARAPDGLLYAREYDRWRAGGIAVQTTVDRATLDWKGNVGTVTVLLERLPIARPGNTVLFNCGPEVMMHFTALSA